MNSSRKRGVGHELTDVTLWPRGGRRNLLMESPLVAGREIPQLFSKEFTLETMD